MPANFGILLKKNLLLEKRSWTWTLFEIMIIVVCYTVIVINPAVKSKNYLLELEEAKRTQLYENRTNIYDLSAFLRLKGIQKNRLRYGLIYAPPTPFTTRMVEATRKALRLHDSFAVPNEQSLINHFNDQTFLAGIYFHNVSSDAEDGVPEKLSVTISFPSEFRTSNHPEVFHRLWLTRCTGVLDDLDTDILPHADLYLREGFLQIQHRLFMEWIQMLQVQTAPDIDDSLGKGELDERSLGGVLPLISIRSFRQRTYHEPCHTESSTNIIWFLYYFTFFVPFLRVIRKFACEREENIPVHHWIYGYEQGHHWMAHFLISFLHFLLLALIVISLVTIEWTSVEKYHIFRHVNPVVFLLFVALYITMLLIYAMVVATSFVNTSNCMLFGAAMWLGSYGLFSLIMDSTEAFTTSIVISLLLFFNNFFPYGMRLMKNVDTASDYRRIWLLIYTEVGNIFLLLFLLSVADFIRPGRYKRRSYFNYLFIPYCCYWLRNTRSVIRSGRNERGRRTSAIALDRPTPSWHNFECGPFAGQEILCMKNVTTYLDRIRNKQQLKKVTLRFFKDEITVILGAHSTGKTRLMSMLAGLQKPHAGYIYFNGDYDIYRNWSHYRRMIDVSMPNNPLYESLTVLETMCYFCEIKQRQDSKKTDLEVNKWLTMLNPFVAESGQMMVRDLNFSQKRLLSLCCTLACDRTIILLDEPTVHMTLPEQRYYWEILRLEKQNRAIIVSTFSTDEADAIGDRIGILSEGCLLAWGTPFFLKTRFGIGFDLIILKDPKISTLPLTELINQYIPNIKPYNEIGDQLIYKLPSAARDLFQRMLIHLEKQSKELGILKMRMSGSELSEIYMTLGTQESSNTTAPEINKYAQTLKFTKGPSQDVTHQQMYAMLYKKMIHQAPNIIPIIMIFAVFLLILLINEMTKRIHVPSTVNDGIHLGLPMDKSQHDFLNDFNNCTFLEVAETLSARYQIKLNNKPKHFLFKHFECGQRTYKEDVLQEVGIYDKLGAVEFLDGGKHMVLWINERIFHTAALSLNLAHNLILKDLYPNKPQRLTTIVNKPMIIPLHVKINLIDNQISHLRLPLIMGIIMPITMSCFIVGLVEERYSHLLTLQRIAGLRMPVFWLVGILWDFGTFFTFSVIYFLVMVASAIEGFGVLAKILTLLLLNVHGLSALCLIYLMSLFMPNSSYRSFLTSIVVQFTIGLCGYVFYWDVADNSRLFYYLLCMSPTFSLLDGIGNVYTENKEQEYCRERCLAVAGCTSEKMCSLIPNCCSDKFFKWSPPGILPSLTYMLLSGALSSTAYFLVNIYRNEKLHSATPRIKQMGTVCFPHDDEQVVREKVRIADMNMNTCRKHLVLADQIEERIPRHGKRLNTISFGLERKMCMGIYGSRHSGKSNLIQQLIGERSVRFGEMYICGKDCKYEPEEAYQCVGYCPQDGGLCNAFTPRQLFTLLFMLRGVPKPMASDKLREISRSLNLRRYMSQRISFLPTDVKRKLNIGISLIICNKVLILDEPTRGMSAMDCRIIWNVLRQARSSGNAIIFSSSDSLECETLSDKIIVVDNGEMLAIGSAYCLRSKYTKGFCLEVRLLFDGTTAEETEENLQKDIENMLTYVHFLHEDSTLVNRYRNTLKYYIPVENVRYSYLFGSLEKNRRRLNISEYTIGQASLLTALDNILGTRSLREPYRKKIIYGTEVKADTFPSRGTDAPDFESLKGNTQGLPEELQRSISQENTDGEIQMKEENDQVEERIQDGKQNIYEREMTTNNEGHLESEIQITTEIESQFQEEDRQDLRPVNSYVSPLDLHHVASYDTPLEYASEDYDATQMDDLIVTNYDSNTFEEHLGNIPAQAEEDNFEYDDEIEAEYSKEQDETETIISTIPNEIGDDEETETDKSAK